METVIEGIMKARDQTVKRTNFFPMLFLQNLTGWH
jgi:hypothetical protein